MSELGLQKNVGKKYPESWILTHLGEIITPIKGKKPKILGKKSKHYSIPYINIRAFEKKEFNEYTDTNSNPQCIENDILIVWDGARSGLVGTGVSGVVGSTLMKLQYYLIDPKYLYYFLQINYEYINKNPKGIGIPHVNPNLLWTLQFPLPPLNEQKRIVGKTEELFSLVDSAKQSLENVKVHLKQYKNSLLKRAFDYSTLTKFRDVCELMSGKAFKKKEYASHGVRLFQIANVSFGKVIWDSISYLPPNYLQKYPELELKEGDIVMALNRPILNGKIKVGIIGTVDVPSILYQRVGKFITSDIIKKYFFYYLQSPQFIKQLKSSLQGVDQPFINKPKLLDFLIPIPTIKEQKRIVAKIEESFSIIEKNEKLVDSLLLQYNQIKNSILKQAFKGKLVPQDPNDEPAQILLEKIQQERKKNGK